MWNWIFKLHLEVWNITEVRKCPRFYFSGPAIGQSKPYHLLRMFKKEENHNHQSSQEINTRQQRKIGWSIGESICWVGCLSPRSVPCPCPGRQVRREYLSQVQVKEGMYFLWLYCFLLPFICYSCSFSLKFSSFICDFHPLFHLRIIWSEMWLSLLDSFKSFSDNLGFAFLFLEQRECFHIPPIVLQNLFYLTTFLLKL